MNSKENSNRKVTYQSSKSKAETWKTNSKTTFIFLPYTIDMSLCSKLRIKPGFTVSQNLSRAS